MPPPGVRLVLGVLVASLITGSKAAYSLSFYDCHNIRNLHTFKVSNTCNRENPDTEMDTITTTFTLLQKQDIVTDTAVVSSTAALWTIAGPILTQRS